MRRPLLLACLVSTPALAAPPAMSAMQPGLWEVTRTMEMSNVPMKMPPQVSTQCIKKEDLADARKSLPVDKTCTLDEVKQDGNATTGKATCKMDTGEMKGTGRMTVKPQSYEGSMDLVAKLEEMDFTMKQTFSGKRLGDCK
ncbi:MAG: hypothetical protein RL653_159 [Pseudomonadota bacterium]|jgi:hypothetical protein